MKTALLTAVLLTAGAATAAGREPGATRKVLSATFSPDGTALATVWDDRVVRV